MPFSKFNLSAQLMDAVKALSYDKPTPIQNQAIPVALEGRDVIGCAETGSGKTAAFLLPIIERITRGEQRQALILSPTREIALQTEAFARVLSNRLKMRIVSVIGGADMHLQTRGLAADPHIIIATPGRLIDHMRRRHNLLDEVGILVLDEADRLLDMGFLPDIRRILDSLSLDRQSLLFSATMSGDIGVLAEETLLDPVHIQVGRRATTVSTLEQSVYSVLTQAKLPFLLLLLKTEVEGGTLVFVRTKRSADRLAAVLKLHLHRVGLLHGDRTQSQRVSAMADFRAGHARVLVATDLAARGIDVSSLTRVINYDVPAYPEDYVHRVGRTARAGGSGQAITLAAPQEEADLLRIERLIGQPLTRCAMAGFSDGREFASPSAVSGASPSAGSGVRSFSPRRRR